MLLPTFELALLFLGAIYPSAIVQVHAEVVFVEYSQVFMGSIEFTHWNSQHVIAFQNAIAEFAKGRNISSNEEVTIECHLKSQGRIRKRKGKEQMRNARRNERRRRIRRRRIRKTEDGRNLSVLRNTLNFSQFRGLMQNNEDSRTRENMSSLTQ